METYGTSQLSVLDTLNAMNTALSEYATKVKSLESGSFTSPSYSMSGNSMTSGESITSQMKSNSDAWANSTDESEKKSLHDANQRLARNYEEVTGQKLTYNSAEGAWYADDGFNKKRIYHDGGVAGGKYLTKASEEFGKLMKGEPIITLKQADGFMKSTLPNLLANQSAFKSQGIKIEKLFDVNFTGDINKDTIPEVQRMLKDIPGMVAKEFNGILSARGIKNSPLKSM